MSLDSNIPANTHPHDELAVYALDALEADERFAVEQHLAGCPSCRAELDRHLETLAELSTPEDPPAHVWDRIAEEVAGTRRAAPPPPPPPAPGLELGEARPFQPPAFDPERPRHRAPRRTGRGGRPAVWLGGLAAAAAIAVVVGVGMMALGGESSQTVSDLAQAAADDPDSQVVTLLSDAGEAQARVVVADDGTGYVLLDELPSLPEGRSYQLWKLDDAQTPVSLSVLGDGSAEAAAFTPPADTTTFALSEEPDTGVPTPTGPIIASGTIS